jgi:hypothetical protein
MSVWQKDNYKSIITRNRQTIETSTAIVEKETQMRNIFLSAVSPPILTDTGNI